MTKISSYLNKKKKILKKGAKCKKRYDSIDFTILSMIPLANNQAEIPNLLAKRISFGKNKNEDVLNQTFKVDLSERINK